MVVGLGNPGRSYEKTRHNAGFMALDILEQDFGAKSFGSRQTALMSRASEGSREILFVRPLTFMNRSGTAVNDVGSYYKIPRDHIIVIADDVSMEVGRLRIRDKGSDGGHNGLKDIIRVLGSQEFLRIKIGVGQKPRPDYDLADWVLSRFGREDLGKLEEVLRTVPGAVRLLLEGDYAGAQNRFNR